MAKTKQATIKIEWDDEAKVYIVKLGKVTVEHINFGIALQQLVNRHGDHIYNITHEASNEAN